MAEQFVVELGVAAKEYLPAHLYLPPLNTFGARSIGVGGRLLQVSDRAMGLAYKGARLCVEVLQGGEGEGVWRTITLANRLYTYLSH